MLTRETSKIPLWYKYSVNEFEWSLGEVISRITSHQLCTRIQLPRDQFWLC